MVRKAKQQRDAARSFRVIAIEFRRGFRIAFALSLSRPASRAFARLAVTAAEACPLLIASDRASSNSRIIWSGVTSAIVFAPGSSSVLEVAALSAPINRSRPGSLNWTIARYVLSLRWHAASVRRSPERPSRRHRHGEAGAAAEGDARAHPGGRLVHLHEARRREQEGRAGSIRQREIVGAIVRAFEHDGRASECAGDLYGAMRQIGALEGLAHVARGRHPRPGGHHRI